MTPELDAGVDPAAECEMDVRPTTLGGRRVIEKEGTARARGRLRREAAALEQLSSRGIIELIEIRESESSTTLVTAYVGARTLADAARLQPGEILRALRETCVIVMGIHERGWAHGNITAEHVILGPRARVRLCSLGDAVPLESDPIRFAIRPPSTDESGPSGTSDGEVDLLGLIALITGISELPISGDSLRERREWRRMRSHLAQAADPRPRPAGDSGADDPGISTVEKIKRLAQCLEFDAKTPRGISWLWGIRTRSARKKTDRRMRPTPKVLNRRSSSLQPLRVRGLVFAAGVVAAGVVLLTGLVPKESGSDAAAQASNSHRPSERKPTAGKTTAGRPGRAAEDGAPLPHGSPGNLVVSDGRIYRVGVEGDRVVVGDWNCDGDESALLLRPSSGEVYVFREWASEGQPSAAELISVIEGATELFGHSGDCGAATVRTGSGSDLPLIPPEA
ncbi:MAG: hypothetical protein WBF71_01580 [Microthrixaceae bacterium]